jgi:5-carboxymethyl-2-hydroxymuconate isomerase|tara:strand:+ start:356 stop:718 length:363 start_codon:yes stop_codon:yes gene_type:complete
VAHFIVEYSNNLPEADLAIGELLRSLTEKAVETGLFPVSGIRSRAHQATHHLVMNSTDAGFVHVNMNVGQGRSHEDRHRAGEALFEVVKDHLAGLMEREVLLLSFEMREIDDVKFNYRSQ